MCTPPGVDALCNQSKKCANGPDGFIVQCATHCALCIPQALTHCAISAKKGVNSSWFRCAMCTPQTLAHCEISAKKMFKQLMVSLSNVHPCGLDALWDQCWSHWLTRARDTHRCQTDDDPQRCWFYHCPKLKCICIKDCGFPWNVFNGSAVHLFWLQNNTKWCNNKSSKLWPACPSFRYFV